MLSDDVDGGPTVAMEFQFVAGKAADEQTDKERQKLFDRAPLVTTGALWTDLLRHVPPLNPGYRNPLLSLLSFEPTTVNTGVVSGGSGYEAKPRDLPYATGSDPAKPQKGRTIPKWPPVMDSPTLKEDERGNLTFCGLPVRVNAPMIDWEKMAGSYAAALAEANTRIRLLEDQVDALKPKETPAPSKSDVLARCMKADRTLDAYGR